MRKKILVVDDEESLARGIKLNLEETGDYEVRIEIKGPNVLAAAIEFRPDLIFLDFIMPDMDGSDVANQLQQEPMTKDIPVVFLTAIASKEDTQKRGDIIGGQYIIPKPVTTEKLVETIEKLLS